MVIYLCFHCMQYILVVRIFIFRYTYIYLFIYLFMVIICYMNPPSQEVLLALQAPETRGAMRRVF